VAQPATESHVPKLSFGAILLGILGGIIGLVIGALLGLLLGSLLASAFHVTTMEGAAGYFAVTVALIITAIVTPLSIILTLYWRGVRRIWLLIGLFIVCVSIFGIAAASFGAWYMAQPHILNANGPTPLLEFEVKGPDGVTADSIGEFEVKLDTDRNSMPGYWHDPTNDHGVRAGYVELYFRTSQRLLVLRSPDNDDRIFQLNLPTNPMRPKYRDWSDWKKPNFVAKNGEQPSRPADGDDYRIRYKVDYQDR
jgi:hypothetical protein